MNDDVKKALEDTRKYFYGGEPSWLRVIRAHIDGERERSKKVFAEGVAVGRARFLLDLKALLEIK